ncbi:MAG: hypothetical protein LBT48_01415 [Prevotellaceae bacterium]|nr:hypothetical protein [Prevotellaceae bacterium]
MKKTPENTDRKPARRSTRRHHKALAFNDAENEVIKHFCAKYKITNRTKFFREAIISAILRKMEEDHPTLF